MCVSKSFLFKFVSK